VTAADRRANGVICLDMYSYVLDARRHSRWLSSSFIAHINYHAMFTF